MNFLFYLVPVRVVSPEKDVKGNGKCLPDKLDLAVLHRLICHVYDLCFRAVFFIRDLLNCWNSNIKESNRRGEADERYKKHWVEADQVGKCDRVEELDLNKRILRVTVEVNIHHQVVENNQAKDYDLGAYNLNFFDQVDGQDWNQNINHLNINGLNVVASSIWSFLGLIVVQGGSTVVVLYKLVDYLEKSQDSVKCDRGPNKTHTVLNRAFRDNDLIVFDLLVDVIKL